MFWQIVIFIVLVFIGGLFRQMLIDTQTKGKSIFYLLLLLIISFGLSFYLAFVIRWALILLLDFKVNYWAILGLLYVYNYLIKKMD